MTEEAIEELARLRGENAALVRELADERHRYRRTLGTSLVGYIVSSFETGRYVEVNSAFADLLGYSREEILSSDPYQFWIKATFGEDLEAERQQLQRILAGEIDEYGMPKRWVRKDGGVRSTQMEFSCVRDEQGRARFGIITASDLQALKTSEEARSELEAKLRQAEKLETVGRLVGGVAHDFNNRLMVIMGYADMVREGVAEDPVVAGQAEIVVSSAQRAAELTRQLLAYSRLQVLRPRSVDLNAVVDGIRRLLERVIGEQVELATELGARSRMLADPGQIEQVLMNLVINARDAMPNGGRITLRTFDASVTEAQPIAQLGLGSYVAFAVTDTGTGVPESIRARIFEPFFTTKGVGHGTGLGLAMVDSIVRQSGGAIVLESSPGQGTNFTVYLPKASEAAHEVADSRGISQVEHAIVRSSGRSTLLVVEDEDDVRRLLGEVLRIGPFDVLEARDAQQALELAKSNSVTLLITDIGMPGMSGTELADVLRAQTPALKVLFISGYAEREGRRQLHDSEQFIPKPFLPAELFQRVNTLLRPPGDLEQPARAR